MTTQWIRFPSSNGTTSGVDIERLEDSHRPPPLRAAARSIRVRPHVDLLRPELAVHHHVFWFSRPASDLSTLGRFLDPGGPC